MPFLFSCREGYALYGMVDRFRTSGSKDYFACLGIDQAGDLLAGCFECFHGGVADLVLADGVPKISLNVAGHGLLNLGMKGRAGNVVQVYGLHNHLFFGSCSFNRGSE
ncbi:MAG: hypothetical protein A4E65_02469 [Syntrophorhabdus sp. PtaU1.Bin153]|nr:MAG: hypothetical protein A4E65_02469 [Syntrophorhabdus sp. PtaU1.Bin153]